MFSYAYIYNLVLAEGPQTSYMFLSNNTFQHLRLWKKTLMENKYATASESVVDDEMADDDLQILFVKEAPMFLTLHLELIMTTCEK